MRIVVFTSNAVRHRYVANYLSKHSDECLVVSECRPSDAIDFQKAEDDLTLIEKHFRKRYETEMIFFAENNFFNSKTIPLIYKEANLNFVHKTVKEFNPDMVFVFGSSILKNPLLSLLPQGKSINLHLGLSPYYRGSGTNFWPLVNNEIEYVGSTILHIGPGVDTGDIITHVTPKIEANDDVHTLGCKVIKESAKRLITIMNIVKQGKNLQRIKQWNVANPRYYKIADFNDNALLQYNKNLQNGMMKNYLKSPKTIKLINL